MGMSYKRARYLIDTMNAYFSEPVLAAAIPLGRDGLTGPVTWAIAAVCFVLLLTTRIDTLWMILGPALVSLTVSSVGLMSDL
jgi:chromate transporter